jgi:N-acetylglucosamine-6-phosphate deacetylase
MALMDVSVSEALTMAAAAPAAFLGLGRDQGRIAKGLRANLVAADDAMTVRATWIDGVPIFGAT